MEFSLSDRIYELHKKSDTVELSIIHWYIDKKMRMSRRQQELNDLLEDLHDWIIGMPFRRSKPKKKSKPRAFVALEEAIEKALKDYAATL